MGLFAGIEKAEAKQSGGEYLGEGDYLLEVKQIKTGKTRKRADFFAAEFKVIEATAEAKNRPGTEATHMVMLASDYAHSDIKAMVSAIMGVKFDSVDERGVELIVSEKQPLRGKKVRATARTKTTLAGKAFTKITYYPVVS